jgi:hypothetical protein
LNSDKADLIKESSKMMPEPCSNVVSSTMDDDDSREGDEDLIKVRET